jgi:outer membrane protein
MALLGTGSALAQTQPSVPAAAQPIGLASDSLTLGGTVQAALDANPSITNLTELTNAATSRLTQTQAGFLPQVTGTATYTRMTSTSQRSTCCWISARATQPCGWPNHRCRLPRTTSQ